MAAAVLLALGGGIAILAATGAFDADVERAPLGAAAWDDALPVDMAALVAQSRSTDAAERRAARHAFQRHLELGRIPAGVLLDLHVCPRDRAPGVALQYLVLDALADDPIAVRPLLPRALERAVGADRYVQARVSELLDRVPGTPWSARPVVQRLLEDPETRGRLRQSVLEHVVGWGAKAVPLRDHLIGYLVTMLDARKAAFRAARQAGRQPERPWYLEHLIEDILAEMGDHAVDALAERLWTELERFPPGIGPEIRRAEATEFLARALDRTGWNGEARLRRIVARVDPAKRIAMLDVIAADGGQSAWLVSVLAGLMHAADEEIRAHAAHLIRKQGPPAVPHLVHALRDPSHRVRYAALASLSAFDRLPANSLPLLLDVIADDEAALGVSAIQELPKFGPAGSPSLKVALARLRREAAPVSRATAGAIADLAIYDPQQFTRAYRRSSRAFQIELLSVLEQMEHRGPPMHLLLERLREDTARSFPDRLRAAAVLLADDVEGATAFFEPLLRSEDVAVRQAALGALAQGGPRAARFLPWLLDRIPVLDGRQFDGERWAVHKAVRHLTQHDAGPGIDALASRKRIVYDAARSALTSAGLAAAATYRKRWSTLSVSQRKDILWAIAPSVRRRKRAKAEYRTSAQALLRLAMQDRDPVVRHDAADAAAHDPALASDVASYLLPILEQGSAAATRRAMRIMSWELLRDPGFVSALERHADHRHSATRERIATWLARARERAE